ncbi:MAG: WD40 repeat domain-containing protein [Gemmataceae bacterium]
MHPVTLLLLLASLPDNPDLSRLPLAEICAVAWRADGSALIAGPESSEVVVWNPQTGRDQARYCKAVKPLAPLSLHGQVLASDSEMDYVQLWHVRTGKPLRTFSTLQKLRSLCLQPDGQSLAGSTGEGILGWNAQTSKPIGIFPRENSVAWCVAHSPICKQLFLTGEVGGSGELGTWDQRLPAVSGYASLSGRR